MSDHPRYRALTIHQPWAWLILHAGKDVENRGWNGAGYRGRFLVHAGKAYDPHGDEFAAELGIEIPAGLPLGAIVGAVTLLDVVQGADSVWAIDGQWHWMLAAPAVLAEPIPARGFQKWWHFAGELPAPPAEFAVGAHLEEDRRG